MDNEVAELRLSMQEGIQLAICKLPFLTKDEIPLDDACPICMNSFEAIMDGKAREGLDEVSPGDYESVGVTKLIGCGHIFCRACLVEWIRGYHGTCPSCRNVFSKIRPVSDSDNESSDGDYVPGDDEDDDDFFDSDDAFMETDSAFDDMDIEVDLEEDVDVAVAVDLWEAEAANANMENWGLSDGDGSESVSEVEGLTMSGELPSESDVVEVYSDSGERSGVLQAADHSAESK